MIKINEAFIRPEQGFTTITENNLYTLCSIDSFEALHSIPVPKIQNIPEEVFNQKLASNAPQKTTNCYALFSNQGSPQLIYVLFATVDGRIVPHETSLRTRLLNSFKVPSSLQLVAENNRTTPIEIQHPLYDIPNLRVGDWDNPYGFVVHSNEIYGWFVGCLVKKEQLPKIIEIPDNISAIKAGALYSSLQALGSSPNHEHYYIIFPKELDFGDFNLIPSNTQTYINYIFRDSIASYDLNLP